MESLLRGTPLGDAWEHFTSKESRARRIPSPEPRPKTTDAEKRLTISQVLAIDDYIDNDPKQWALSKKLRVVAIISFYTFAVYAGSAIYIASVEGVMHEYGSSTQLALLGLSLYVLGCKYHSSQELIQHGLTFTDGVGPLLWAPLSEISWIGRNPVYWITALIFLICSVATATARSLSAFFVLRFLQGFFGSPCLANGGASLHDIFEGRYLPLSLSVWVAFAYAGPAIGPLMASYLVENQGWRISMWEIVACGALAFVGLLLLPETYAPKVLYTSQQQTKQAGEQTSQTSRSEESVLATLRDALIKPMQIMLQDPAIAYVNLYTSYLYSCYYTFFDGFPLIYTYTYKFSSSRIGLVFLPIIVGCATAATIYAIYIIRSTKPKHEANPEARLIPALYAVWAPPMGILIFGWTAQHSNHWIWGMVGLVIYAGGVFIILQCVIMYILDSYPRYAASLFAANDLSRSALAAGAVHFGLPLYVDLGAGKACSILAAVSVLGIGGMFVLYYQGSKLRARSRFTG